MSLLRESVADISGATRMEVTPVVRTTAAEFIAPPTVQEGSGVPGEVSLTISSGEYGEIALTGEYLVGVAGLYITVNGVPYAIPLVPWVPPA
jgi:hypothetical protein